MSSRFLSVLGVAASLSCADRVPVSGDMSGGMAGVGGPGSVTISEFAIPGTGCTLASCDPYDITAGPDGALWFTGSNNLSDYVARITTSGAITMFALPHPCWAQGITVGPDGALWFTEFSGTNIGRISTSGDLMDFTSDTNIAGITSGSDGALWFTESPFNRAGPSEIGRMTTSGTVTYFPTPTSGALLDRIVPGPDGALWFTEGGSIGRVTLDGQFNEYAIPPPTELSGIVPGPDGALWFTEVLGNKIGRITTSGVVSEYAIPTADSLGYPSGIAVGPDGALWFTEGIKSSIGRVTTAGEFTEYPTPTADSFPIDITMGPDGALGSPSSSATRSVG